MQAATTYFLPDRKVELDDKQFSLLVEDIFFYISNSPYATYRNLSTLQLTTNDIKRDAMISKGYNMATMANGTVDASWSTCVGCAVLSRSFERTDSAIPEACSTCFTNFCWNWTLNTSSPNAYALTPILGNEELTSGAPPTKLSIAKGHCIHEHHGRNYISVIVG